MATVIHTDGRIEEFKFKGLLEASQMIDGSPWDVVRSVDPNTGYTIFVSDEGLLNGYAINQKLLLLTRDVLVGPAIVVSHEEAGEVDLIPTINKDAKRTFELHLARLRGDNSGVN